MARSIWSGSVSFGLVNVPVKLYSAVSPKNVKFNQINGPTGNRVRQKKVDEVTGKEVAYEEIVKGFEIAPDKYVIIEPEELDSLAPENIRTIAIESFALFNEIDPMVFDSSYYLSPSQSDAIKPYRLLAQALYDTGKCGIGRVILRSKEALAIVRASNPETLLISTLVWADEVNPIPGANDGTTASESELAMATTLIEALTEEFDYASYQDNYRGAVLKLIEQKAAGEEVTVPEPKPQDEPTPDLMAALTASLEASKKKPAKTTTKKKVTA
jgi:DNA end-binding protein Ku